MPYRTVFHLLVTVPGDIKYPFTSKAKAVLFLARFEQSFGAWQVMSGEPNSLEPGGMRDYTAEMKQLLTAVRKRTGLRGNEQIPELYFPGDDDMLERVKRIIERV